MGIAVVGGMLTSTFLTLLVIPVVYVAFSRLGLRSRQSPTPKLPPTTAATPIGSTG